MVKERLKVTPNNKHRCLGSLLLYLKFHQKPRNITSNKPKTMTKEMCTVFDDTNQ